jgi:hypothetical protein
MNEILFFVSLSLPLFLIRVIDAKPEHRGLLALKVFESMAGGDSDCADDSRQRAALSPPDGSACRSRAPVESARRIGAVEGALGGERRPPLSAARNRTTRTAH